MHRVTAVLANLSVTVLLACGGSRVDPATGLPIGAMGEEAAIARARADSIRLPYTEADIRFMSGMISHHAQAIKMAKWSATHGASPAVVRFSERVVTAQTDEIALMQDWLEDRGLPVPDPADPHAAHGAHAGMPGMLTEAQLAELDAAHGEEWDRLFLTYMIQHHEGALTMVDTLFGSYGAAQGDDVFRIATGIAADQTAEIERMQTMLRELLFEN